MERLALVIGIIVFLLPQLGGASPCNNSTVRIINNTDTEFHIQTYVPRANTQIIIANGSTDLTPHTCTTFEVQSGHMALGNIHGEISFTGQERQYDLYYFFHSALMYTNCTAGADILTNKYDFDPEHYKITCKGNGETIAPALVCEINEGE